MQDDGMLASMFSFSDSATLSSASPRRKRRAFFCFESSESSKANCATFDSRLFEFGPGNGITIHLYMYLDLHVHVVRSYINNHLTRLLAHSLLICNIGIPILGFLHV